MRSICPLTLGIALGGAVLAQMPRPAAITSISVCSPTGSGGQGSCPSGSFDTHQIVLAPDGNSINRYGVNAVSDEHSSVFSPGTLAGNSDYLFFVAAGTSLNPAIGATVLSGGAGPDKNGQWTFDLPKADGYGSYPAGFGHVFVSPLEAGCPMVADGNPVHQDQTFDMNYAAPGSVVKDPTNGPGSLLMIYAGVNVCVGDAGGSGGGSAYISVDVATSLDYGKTWPTYRGTPTFNFIPLPAVNKAQGPNAPSGALGVSVCMGNNCTATPPSAYGRYPVLSPPYALATAMATGKPLPGILADAEPSAFLDDASANPMPYVYEIHGYHPSSLASPPLPNGRASDLIIARAKLNGGTAPLSFAKWNGQSFGSPGIGGTEIPVLPDGPYQNCGEPNTQGRHSGSISYVEATQQYLLLFNCLSPTNPAGAPGTGNPKGEAWFYSTSYDLSDPTQWSPPQEVIGSWNLYDAAGNGCWKGLYPTMMSLNSKPGHLGLSGHIFYMWGCGGGGEQRQYSSRVFTITTGPVTPLAHAADGNNFKTTLILTSAGTSPAPYTLQFNDAGGNNPVPPVPLELGSLGGTTPAGGSATIRTAGTGSFVGWAELNAPASVGGSVIYSQQTQLPTIQEGTTALTANGSQHFFLPFDNTQGAVTAMALTNPGSASASIAVTLRYSDGTMETPAYPPLTGRNHQSFALPAQFTNSSNRSGVAEFVSSVPLYSVVFRFNPTGAFTALDVVQPGTASPSITRTLSHAGDGSGFKTTVLLTNTAAQPEPYVLRFDDPQGNAPSPPVALELGSLTGMIPAGGSATIRTAGTGSFIGWAELTAPTAVGGSVIYSQPHLTSIQEGTATIVSAGTQHFFLPFDNNNGAMTAMALTNSEASAANLTVTVRIATEPWKHRPLRHSPAAVISRLRSPPNSQTRVIEVAWQSSYPAPLSMRWPFGSTLREPSRPLGL